MWHAEKKVRFVGGQLSSCVIHTVKGFDIVNKGFGIVNKAEIDVFLELSCCFDDPVDVGNFISSSSAFSNILYKYI